MASLETLLYGLLSADTELAGLLSSYGGSPAISELLAAIDSDEGWADTDKPRLQFRVTRQEDSERRVDGSVTLTVIHAGESMVPSAAVDARLRQLLDGATFQADEGTLSLHWSAADPFDEEEDFRGIEATYDLIAWPAGLTYAPDPVSAVRTWAQGSSPDLQVDPAIWAPADAAPALYWRLAAIDQIEPEPWGAWITCRLQGHVLAVSPSIRLEWVRRVVEGLALAGRAPLGDGSQLFFQAVSANSEADHLRAGQIRLTARFGILGPVSDDPVLTHAGVSGSVAGEVT